MKLSKQIFSIEKIPDKRQYNRWPANIVYHKEAAMDVFWWSWQRLIISMLFGLHIENMLLVLLGNRFTGTGWTYALINTIAASSGVVNSSKEHFILHAQDILIRNSNINKSRTHIIKKNLFIKWYILIWYYCELVICEVKRKWNEHFCFTISNFKSFR